LDGWLAGSYNTRGAGKTMDLDIRKVGEVVLRLRQARGWSRADLIEATRPYFPPKGVSSGYIYNLEHGKQGRGAERAPLDAVLKALDTSLHEILGADAGGALSPAEAEVNVLAKQIAPLVQRSKMRDPLKFLKNVYATGFASQHIFEELAEVVARFRANEDAMVDRAAAVSPAVMRDAVAEEVHERRRRAPKAKPDEVNVLGDAPLNGHTPIKEEKSRHRAAG
jgi:transcriptional regulator with XRE-family HTH domain